MKISNNKKQLAKIISENGGWRDGANLALFGKESGRCYLLKTDEWPVYNTTLKCFLVNASDVVSYFKSKPFANWHQTIVSRDEYFHLYPAQDANLPSGDGVTDDTAALQRILDCSRRAPTIEQLAAEYRNRKDYAERKQQEADAAKAEADVKLAELVAAGKAVGLAVSVAGVEPEPELVITDWRDLQLGDVIEYVDGDIKDKIGMTGPVVEFAKDDSDGMPVLLKCDNGRRNGRLGWPRKWRFIRRPAKGGNNA